MANVVPNRQGVQQTNPQPNVDLAAFPAKLIPAKRVVYRQHASKHSPWYFASGDRGRFNLDEPSGTLYLATTPKAAALELVGPDAAANGYINASVVNGRLISKLRTPVAIRAACLTSPNALNWRIVVHELISMPTYIIPRAWARAFAVAGFAGLWVPLRFSDPKPRGIALFGKSGTRNWPRDVNPETARKVCEKNGISVIDPPHSRALNIVSY